MKFVEELARLAGPFAPVEPPTEMEWVAVERSLGQSLPPDYKSLLAVFGSGHFGCELYLLNPRSTCDHIRLSADRLRLCRETMKYIEESMQIHLYPDPKGLRLAGVTAERLSVFLKPMDQQNDQVWHLVVCDFDVEDQHEYGLTVSEFIYRLYQDTLAEGVAERLRQLLWPRSGIPLFTPWPKPVRGGRVRQ